MKKQFIALATIFLLAPQISFAQEQTFSDLYETNPYFEAVNYLYEIGVINGYPDNTFKPDKTVTRVEFLKLALISSGIETDIYSPTLFPDIDENAWYAPYVRKAKNEGWIEGYPDGTFKPEQGVNKAEALKMMAQIQDWKVETEISESFFKDVSPSAWYAPYTEYAHSKNLLDERGNFFIADAQLSRGKVSEYLFRAFITNLSGEDEFSKSLSDFYPASQNIIVTHPQETVEQIESVEFTPNAFRTVDKNFFNNITLDTNFTNHFYLNEVYFFTGALDSSKYDQAFIFLVPVDSISDQEHITYLGSLSGDRFTIPVTFRHPGNYKLGLIPGTAGESKIVNISVFENLPSGTPNPNLSAPKHVSARYADTKTTFSWENNNNGIVKLIFSENGKSKEFIFRQGRQSFNAEYIDFMNFTPGDITYHYEGAKTSDSAELEITSNWAASPERTLNAITHASIKNRDGISVSNFPETLNALQTISFSGTTGTEIFTKSYIIKPDGTVDTVLLTTTGSKSTYYGSETITANNNFGFSYTPSSSGTYIIEINKTDGSALINAPVYVATGLPLIPDYFDMNENGFSSDTYSDLSALRSELLNLINKERVKTGISPIVLDSKLNTLAQEHSEDMVERNFFGHINPDGKTPEDRRIELNIPTSVNENLATAGSVRYAHEGLMRSGVHRLNIIDPDWTKVGLGIVQNNNSYYITQEFSKNPLTESDFETFEQEFINRINQNRNQNGLTDLIKNYSAMYAADQWSQRMADQSFFDFQSPNGETLSGIINANLPDKSVQAIIFESPSQDRVINEILANSQIRDSFWGEIGLGIKTDSIGTLKVTLLLTTH